MTVTDPTYSALILGAPDVPVTLRTDAGQITLDSGAAPHVDAPGLTLALPDPAVLDDLDPRDGRRLVVEAGGRVFDLGIREAAPNREDGTVTVRLASDEALLADFAQLVDDLGAWAHQGSVRALVNYVLGKIGATLEPGAADANLTAKWDATNLLVNPNVAASIANWTSVGTSALVRNSGAGVNGVAGYAAATASGTNFEVWPEGTTGIANAPAVDAGSWYSFAAYARVAAGSVTVHPRLIWWDDAGGIITGHNGPTTALTGAFARYTLTAQAPAGAVRASALLRFVGASGNVVHVDAAMLCKGRFVPDFFDGATVDTADYDYAWTGVANASNSTRVALVDAPAPEAFIWDAGTSALEFLRPLVQVAGFRLVCDERRRWTLRSEDYRADGAQAFRYGVNLIDADETLSRDDDGWCDGAVVVYTWTAGGIEYTRTDTFALPGASKIIRREITAPYPGPGRAEYIVRRAQGKGRTVTATKQATWTEAAEQTFSATLDGTPVQVGVAEKVVFDLGGNTVTTTSRTTDTPASAWVLLASGESWLDSPVGASWIGEVV